MITQIKFGAFVLLIFFKTAIFCSQNVHFKISESCEFYLDQMQDPAEMIELKNEPFLAISFGYNCWPAAHLQDHILRKRSFPLDWIITPFDTLYKLLETDFCGFLDIRYITIVNDASVSFCNMPVNTLHGTQFFHDFHLEDWKQENGGIVPINEKAIEDYNAALSRYAKRISRLYHIFDLGIPIYVFRWDITKEQAHKLYSLLNKKFPNSNITLVCIQTKNATKNENWGHPKIKHFVIGLNGERIDPASDRIRNSAWTRVFESLQLLPHDWNTND